MKKTCFGQKYKFLWLLFPTFSVHSIHWRDQGHYPNTQHLYADDTQMLAKATLQSHGACCRKLEACILSVQRWCAARRLQLNPDKTEFICFESAILLQRLQTTGVSNNINGVVIKSVDCIHDLGVHLDSKLNIRFHISKDVSTCFFI